MLQSTLMASQLIPMVRLFSQAFAYCVLRSKYLVLKGISGRTVNNWQVISTDETSTSTSLTPVWICVPPACWRPLLLQVQLFWVQCPFFYLTLFTRISSCEIWGEVLVMQLPELAWLAAEWSCQESQTESRHRLNHSPLCAVCSGLRLTGVNNFSVTVLSD